MDFSSSASPFIYRLRDNDGNLVAITELLVPGPTLAQRAQSPEEEENGTSSSPSLLLMWDMDFGRNLRGCPDWHCRATRDRTLLARADAVIFAHAVPEGMHPARGQYFVHYSQESPVHAPRCADDAPPFNMSFSFRMGTPAASPYGFAARLAPESMPDPQALTERISRIIAGKSKAVAWFVSNCGAPSGREWVAAELRRNAMPVDTFGACGTKRCAKGRAACARLLDNEYFFYFAAENSICTDYLTEKLWDQGLGSWSVPIVLRRSLVHHLLPPRSFVAVDDFGTVAELAAHLKWLIQNPQEYFAFFLWRLEFVAIKLNDRSDPAAERLFGVCQLCRMTRMRPRPIVRLPEEWRKWWDGSCEKPGELKAQLIKGRKRRTGK